MAELTERNMPGHWPESDSHLVTPDKEQDIQDPEDAGHAGTVVGIEQVPPQAERQYQAYVEDVEDGGDFYEEYVHAHGSGEGGLDWAGHAVQGEQDSYHWDNQQVDTAPVANPLESPPPLDNSLPFHSFPIDQEHHDPPYRPNYPTPEYPRDESAIGYSAPPEADQQYYSHPQQLPGHPAPPQQYNRHFPPLTRPYQGQNLAHHRHPHTRPYPRNGPIQIVETSRHSPRDKGPSTSEQMQMMMMSQMMMQQMAAQQMQVAQMAALTLGQGQGQGQGSGPNGNSGQSKKGRKRPKIDIKSKQVRSKVRAPALAPVVIQPRVASFQGGTVESATMENWQEATIILCIALVGLIYLVASRSTKPEEDKTSLAAEHLVPK